MGHMRVCDWTAMTTLAQSRSWEVDLGILILGRSTCFVRSRSWGSRNLDLGLYGDLDLGFCWDLDLGLCWDLDLGLC